MTARFTARCSHGEHTDRATFEAHWKAEHKPVPYGWPVRLNLPQRPFRQPRGWKAPTYKAFDPAHGEVGSWVTMNGGLVTGQVWAVIAGGKRPRVYVADGTTYHEAFVSDLRPAVVVEQPELIAA